MSGLDDGGHQVERLPQSVRHDVLSFGGRKRPYRLQAYQKEGFSSLFLFGSMCVAILGLESPAFGVTLVFE